MSDSDNESFDNVRITLRISKKLDDQLKEAMKKLGYSNKSEAIRTAIRDFVRGN